MMQSFSSILSNASKPGGRSPMISEGGDPYDCIYNDNHLDGHYGSFIYSYLAHKFHYFSRTLGMVITIIGPVKHFQDLGNASLLFYITLSVVF
jgi:hypothetical protein